MALEVLEPVLEASSTAAAGAALAASLEELLDAGETLLQDGWNGGMIQWGFPWPWGYPSSWRVYHGKHH